MNVVVTGASGYIGGETALLLKDAGHHVLGIDFAPLPDHLQGVLDYFVFRDFADRDSTAEMHRWSPDAIIHCAGTSLVGPSLTNPGIYYNNNVVKTLTMLGNVLAFMPECRVIFSSSAATYGNPILTPCQEIDPTEPISPYGESKLMVEWALRSYQRANGLDYVALRYFNACGADSQARHGQAPQATHIIARVLESVKNNTQFVCNGRDFETPDGTCVRDYVHVEDIARAHLLALEATVPAGVYNLGSNQGHSNLEVIAQAQAATGHAIPVEFGPRREGDPDILTADSTKFRNATGWAPQFNLSDIVQHAWAWYNR
jgi:UDP-glucose-4-epimerase GalE